MFPRTTRAPRALLVAGLVSAAACLQPARAADVFVRGDVDQNGSIEITDGIRALGFLFLGNPTALECERSADVDDSGNLDITDGIFLLNYLFLGGGEPPPPFPGCGVDPTPDTLACASFDRCPQVGEPPPVPLAPTVELPPSPTADAVITLRGLAEPGAAIRVTGGEAAVEGAADDAGGFEVAVTLVPNRLNRLYVTQIRDAELESPPRGVEVIQDGEAPSLFVDLPVDGGETLADTVTVAGRVADRLSGFLSLGVTVNGVDAEVIAGIGTNGTFELASFPVVLGANEIVCVATDAVGNRTERAVTVRRVQPDPTLPSLEVAGGSGQRGVVGQPLADPLTARVLRADGSPFPRKLVTFEVARSDGLLSLERDGAPKRRVQVRADDAGFARVFYRLGMDAGCGNHRVRVTSTDVQGSALFCASADPAPPVQINVNSGEEQSGETGAPAPAPLRVWVSDACNGVEGVEVTFRVTRGGGTVSGGTETAVSTAKTGYAEVVFVSGDVEGEQIIEADFEGNLGRPAVFTVFATRRRAGPTSFRGVILDNGEQPLGGALCQIRLATGDIVQTTSTPDGVFLFDDIPGAGPATLSIIGQTVNRVGGAAGEDVPPESFPPLTYEVVLVEGARNDLGGSVLLPRLAPVNDRVYDGTSDLELTVAGMDGLRLHIAAGSVTLRDGTRPSPERPVTLSMNSVHHDDVPMAMTDGAAPPFAWTIQPHGVRFDPPAVIEYPNMSALPPGTITNFLSFDHDTGRFEIIASGEVDEDGARILSDPGSGLTKSGWGCNCPPYTVTTSCTSCIEITAEKVEGGIVPNGDYLCQNQGQQIVLTAEYDPEDSDTCGEGPPVWSVDPPAAGSFPGGNVGDSVVFVQANGYVSESADDVVITAALPEAEARFELTVFHVESESGILPLNGTREIPSEFLPGDADPNRIATFLNDYLALVGYDTREYEEGVFPLTKPLVSGVIDRVEFIPRPGNSTAALWIAVTSGDQTGDVFLTMEDGGELLHQEHMTVVDVKIRRVWSDQFPGVDVNALPDSSGGKGYPYLLMGMIENAATATTRVRAEVEVGEAFGLEDKLRVRFVEREDATPGGDFDTAGESELVEDVGDWTFALEETVFFSPLTTLEYRIVTGFDLDDDGEISREESIEVYGEVENEDYHLKVISPAVYGKYKAIFEGGGLFVALPTAASFLRSFTDGTVPDGATSVSRTIQANRLDHNVGVIWQPDGTATVRQHVFPSDTDLAKDYYENTGFTNFLRGTLMLNQGEVQAFFADPANAGVTEHEFSFDHRDTIVPLDNTDLDFALGTATIDGTTRVRVARDGLSVTSIAFEGTIFDIYDWDYGGGFGPDQLAASVQAGFGTLGEGGGVFFTQVLLDYATTDFEFDF